MRSDGADTAPPVVAVLNTSPDTVLGGYRFVLTTTNTAQVDALVHPRDEKSYEVVGKAEDLDAIVRATREAVRARDVR